MITRAGWATLAGAALLAGAGRVLGRIELEVAAGAGVAIVALAVVVVRRRRDDPVAVRRTVRPALVHVGAPARVELTVDAPGDRPSPVLALIDPIDDRRGAHLHLAPMPAGARTRASYRLPTRHRGEVAVGPLIVERTDPLGLARRRWAVAGQARLVVLPHVDDVPPLPRPAGAEPLSGPVARPRPGQGGDEFHSLRAYVVGDDPRRIHWPVSAGRDELVVRVDDAPHQGRVTIVLDLGRDRADADRFEAMVSAAASLARAHRRAGDLVRLLCSDGRDTGWIAGRAAFDGLLEVLAVTAQGPPVELSRVLALVGDGSDTVATVTGDLPDAEVARLPGPRRPRSDVAALTMIRFHRGPRAGGGPVPARRSLAGATLIDIDPGRSFAPVWTEAVRGSRHRRTVATAAP